MALPEINTILYTSSLSEHTRPVFRQAVRQALANDAKILMLHVVEPMGEMGQALIQNYLPNDLVKKVHDEGIDQIKQLMRERVSKFCEEELSTLDPRPELDIEIIVEEGNHTDQILNVAKRQQVDLIVMGNENRFGHHSPTTHQVTRHAKVPVLAVPTGKQYV
ncbi:universal stress protein [Marinobacterium arenosum]|uniref:universal stress protein n=1 Tax=Marinobacterium arenosum TaxID=2862496 RepID=UPI001C9878F6|nr:universal stress protein [Marinobacterium arenosum]MBY4676024.1 universal stress protein [Marinobacterium arenosum]